MRLSELARLAGRRGATSYLQKHGYVMPAIAVGLQLPGALSRAAERRDSTTKGMNAAGGQPLDPSVAEKRGASYRSPAPSAGGGFDWGSVMSGMSGLKGGPGNAPSLGQHAGHFGGSMLSSMLSPIVQAPAQGLAERLKGVFAPKPPGMMEQLQQQTMQTLGKSVAEAGGSLLKDLASKAISAIGSAGDSAARTAILQSLRREDPILAEANETVLMDAYHSMVRWAPMLATDKNAVRSWLRQAIMTGAGPDYASIKMLAESERAVTGGGRTV